MAQEDVEYDVIVEEPDDPIIFTAVKPRLIVEAQKVGDAVWFYKSAFDADVTRQSFYPKRKLDEERSTVLSAEIQIAGFTFIVSDVSSYSGYTSETEGLSIFLETDDFEAAVAKSVKAGAIEVDELTEYETNGGIKGKVIDPFGFTWIFSSPAKNLENDENKEV